MSAIPPYATNNAETIRETGFQEETAQHEAAQGAHGAAVVFHLLDGLDRVLGDELGVWPRQGLCQGARKHDLRQVGQDIGAWFTVGRQPGHEPIGGCPHHGRVARFGVVAAPAPDVEIARRAVGSCGCRGALTGGERVVRTSARNKVLRF